MVDEIVWSRYQEVHRAGKENVAADALSRSPCGDSPVEGIGQEEVQVAAITSDSENPLTALEPIQPHCTLLTELRVKQRKDPSIVRIIDYLEKNQLQSNIKQSRVIAVKAHSYCVVDGILYLINEKKEKVSTSYCSSSHSCAKAFPDSWTGHYNRKGQ